jgi:hypothetical protein
MTGLIRRIQALQPDFASPIRGVHALPPFDAAAHGAGSAVAVLLGADTSSLGLTAKHGTLVSGHPNHVKVSDSYES